MAGLPFGPGADLPDVDAVLDRIGRLARTDGGSALPVTREEAAAIAGVMRNNLRIAPEFTPGVYRGDMLFFTAAEDASGRAGADAATWPAPDKADAWRPHVDGVLEDHSVPCGHYDMTEPEPIARIGAVVAKALRPASD
ncbi:hypothetical protein STENM223S_05897 [Streptomyces tendae]